MVLLHRTNTVSVYALTFVMKQCRLKHPNHDSPTQQRLSSHAARMQFTVHSGTMLYLTPKLAAPHLPHLLLLVPMFLFRPTFPAWEQLYV